MYIHELTEWPNFHWDENRLKPLLAEVTRLQKELFEDLRHSCFDDVGSSLRDEAALEMLTQEVVKTSDIEGEKLNSDQVRSSIATKLGLNVGGLRLAQGQPNRNVDGIVNVVLDAAHRWKEPLTAERLYSWHALLFPTGYSNFGKITVGQWRDGPMQVVSSPFNKQKVHFEAPESNRLPDEMEKFTTWFEASNSLHPVLKAGIAHLYFVTIHPFDDGNGRIARAIADLAMARADGVDQRFYSMSAQIKSDQKQYYIILEKTQKGTLDITEWLEWFLDCLCNSLQWAQSALQAVIRKARVLRRMEKLDLNERQQKIMLKYLNGEFGERLNTAKYKNSANCSADTANRDLKYLEKLELLERIGQTKSTAYSIKDLSRE
ncbi:Fic family protein [bacterium]|nr:Fic family protein [bacterium]MBP9811415.1 Fic family protein [bacterium]